MRVRDLLSWRDIMKARLTHTIPAIHVVADSPGVSEGFAHRCVPAGIIRHAAARIKNHGKPRDAEYWNSLLFLIAGQGDFGLTRSSSHTGQSRSGVQFC